MTAERLAHGTALVTNTDAWQAALMLDIPGTEYPKPGCMLWNGIHECCPMGVIKKTGQPTDHVAAYPKVARLRAYTVGKCLLCIACRLLEELVPFMDHSINDPEAMRMSGSQQKRKQPSAKVCLQHASTSSSDASQHQDTWRLRLTNQASM